MTKAEFSAPTAGAEQVGPAAESLGLLRGYGPQPLDEAVDPDGRIRPAYTEILGAFDALGPVGLSTRAAQLAARRFERGVVFTAQLNGEPVEQVFPLDLVPRLIGRSTFEHLAAGAVQRARALNAFLADVYGDGARTTPDADGSPRVADIVAAGIVPASLIRKGFRSGAVGLAVPGRPRATVHGLDLLTDQSGRWVVLEDNLQVPSGLAYMLANRATAAASLPEVYEGSAAAADIESPEQIGALLHRALADAAPAGCPRTDPQVVVLSDGPVNSAWYEHRTLAAEMGVPVVGPDDVQVDGTAVSVRLPDAEPLPVDVLYRRLGSDDLLDSPLWEPLLAACRAGGVSICNAPGNGVADDKAIYAFVGPMIRFYLGEEPILADVGTWVLADAGQYSAVRGRMGDLVVKPVDGSGGEGVMIGPSLTRDQVAELEARVAAHPERFIAQDVVHFSTHPTFVDGVLRPRHVDLRMFVLSGADTVLVPAGLSRVALAANELVVNSSQGGGSKDTWILR